MKHLISMALLSIMLLFSTTNKVEAQDVSVSYQTFYDNLAPYGQWVNDPQYGNVWVPNEGSDFRPYGTRGHWVMTDYGNTWVSDDSWGWATYHYGRWTYNPYYGWVWIPGYEWAPAWVSWRYGGGNCGWAPLGPGVELGVSYNCPDSWWVFVGPQYMYQRDCYSHWGGPSYNATYIHQTTIINNYYRDNGTHVRYNYGPRTEQIQSVTHQPVQVYHVTQSNRPGSANIGRNSVSMYRPTVNRSTASTARPANVIQAPKPIGRAQAATNINAGHQPAFRQQIQNNANAGKPGNAMNGQHPGGANNNAQPNRGNNQPAVNQNHGGANPHQAPGRPEPVQNNPQNRNQPQQHTNVQPQSRPQAQPQQHNNMQPQNRPQAQHQQSIPQQRPQPVQQQQRQPMPQQRPQPMPQQRPQAMPQQRSEPAPHMEAPREAPHEGGGGERR